MKRSLIFYRHAKSDWNLEYPNDHERPLTKRGIASAEIMGKLLAHSGQTPDFAVTSSATRAQQTLKQSVASGKWKCPVAIPNCLYNGNAASVLNLIKSFDNSYKCVMLVGHEPLLSGLIALLIDGGHFRFPTACMAKIEFKLDSWKELNQGMGEMRWLLQPAFFLKGSFNFKT